MKTTISDKAAPCPLDQVNRQFHAPAPNMLWVSDFTYVATWSGFVYVAFVIDVYARPGRFKPPTTKRSSLIFQMDSHWYNERIQTQGGIYQIKRKQDLGQTIHAA